MKSKKEISFINANSGISSNPKVSREELLKLDPTFFSYFTTEKCLHNTLATDEFMDKVYQYRLLSH